jgi:hypothetical protein
MKKFLKNIIKDLVRTFDTMPGGFSSRKLTAFVTMMAVVYLHIRYVDTENVVSVLVYDMLFILLLFGIVTFDQLYKFKTGGGITKTDPPAEEPKKDAPPAPVNQDPKNDVG